MIYRTKLLLLVSLACFLGCDVGGTRQAAERLADRRAEKMEDADGRGKVDRMTLTEIRNAVDELQEILPYEMDEDLTLARITVDFNGSLCFWYRASDDLTVKFRKIGWERFKQNAEKFVEDFEFNFDEMPPRLAKLIQQDTISLQYIFEDRYESHLGSFSINDSSMEGEKREGQTQENPFAVRNVSASGE
ncbi:MAG: hypothetical protein AAFV88_19685 [Planctomycetota bacterium]